MAIIVITIKGRPSTSIKMFLVIIIKNLTTMIWLISYHPIKTMQEENKTLELVVLNVVKKDMLKQAPVL